MSNMQKRRTSVAAVCMKVEHDKSTNLEKHIEYIEEAANNDVKLLVFPECAVQGYTWTWDARAQVNVDDEEQHQYFLKESEPIPGPTTDKIAKYAKLHNMVIQLGMAEKKILNDITVIYNSAAVIGPKGLIGVFRKIHMSLNPIFKGGHGFEVFETSIGRIGPLICADLHHPETGRVLALKGADILTMSTAWGLKTRTLPTDIKDHSWNYPSYYAGYKYDLLTRSMCLTNGVWMVSSAQVGAPKKNISQRCFGHSRIIDPSGRIIAQIGYQEGLVIANINIQGGINSNRFDSRRPECYDVLVTSHTPSK